MKRKRANPNSFVRQHMHPKSSSRQDILQFLWDRGLVNNYIKKLEYETIDPETVEDIIQEVWLMICEMPEDRIVDIYTKQGVTGLTAFISGLIYRQIHSNSSVVYRKYKKNFKYMIRISDKAWEVFDETDVMIKTDEKISTVETEREAIIRKIEGNQNDID